MLLPSYMLKNYAGIIGLVKDTGVRGMHVVDEQLICIHRIAAGLILME